jgi:hypothetical protein
MRFELYFVLSHVGVMGPQVFPPPVYILYCCVHDFSTVYANCSSLRLGSVELHHACFPMAIHFRPLVMHLALALWPFFSCAMLGSARPTFIVTRVDFMSCVLPPILYVNCR